MLDGPAQARYISLATFRRSGAEVRTPVWFATSGDRIHVFTAGDAGKVKRLRHTPRVRVAPASARGDVRGSWREGTARLLSERSAIAAAHNALRAKYGWQMLAADVLARLTGRLGRRAWIEIALDAPPRR